MGEALRDSFLAAGCAFNAAMEVRYCNTACVLVESGLGVAVVDPFSPVSGNARGLAIRPFSPTTSTPAFAAWSSHRPLSRLAEVFLQEVRQVVRLSMFQHA